MIILDKSIETEDMSKRKPTRLTEDDIKNIHDYIHVCMDGDYWDTAIKDIAQSILQSSKFYCSRNELEAYRDDRALLEVQGIDVDNAIIRDYDAGNDFVVPLTVFINRFQLLLEHRFIQELRNGQEINGITITEKKGETS